MFKTVIVISDGNVDEPINVFVMNSDYGLRISLIIISYWTIDLDSFQRLLLL